MKQALFHFAYLFLFISLLHSQTYTEINEGGWGEGREFIRPCFADIDRDRLLDLLLGDSDGKIEHLEQIAEGSSTFISYTKNFSEIDLGEGGDPAPRIIDIDNDGLLDLLIGHDHGILYHYEQILQNSLTFSLVSESFNGIDVGRFATPSFTDLDNDGLFDLVLGELDGSLFHYEQETLNTNSFIRVSDSLPGINIGKISTPCFADFNSDGLLDLIVGENLSRLHYYKQSSIGSTVFEYVDSNFCNIGFVQPCPVIVDLNGNDLDDLMIGGLDGYVRHYEQETIGSDSLILISQNVLPDYDFGSYTHPFIIDLDNDNLLDLLVGSSMGVFHLEQDSPSSHFFSIVSDSFNNIDVRGGHPCPIIFDIDGDGLQDLLVGNSQGKLEYRVQSSVNSEVFNFVTLFFNEIDVGDFSMPCFADLDSDNLWDLIIGNGDGLIFHYEQSELNSLNFTLLSESFNEINLPYMVKPDITDLQGDGQLDLIIGNSSGYLFHYEQSLDDPYQFSLIDSNFAEIIVSSTTRPHFADVNGDGLDDIFIGENDGGVLYFQRNSSTEIADKNKLIHEFKLSQNYPNPFNPSTTIKYSIPKQSNVTLKVFDVLGSEVKTIVNKEQSQGNYEVKFDASTSSATGSELSSGIYFYRIQAGDFVETKKMIFLK